MIEFDKYRFKSKEKPKCVKKEKSAYWLVCEKNTDNKNIKGVALENNIWQQDFKKSTFLKPIKRKKNSFYKLRKCKFIPNTVKNTQITRFPKKWSSFQRL